MKFKAMILAVAMLSSSQQVLSAEHTVLMKNATIDGTMAFNPGILKVAVGDTVHFVPQDKGHNSESIPGLIPAGAKGWKGGINEEISVTIDTEGVYVYKCLPHTAMAMVGVIIAGEPTNLEEVKANAEAVSAGFAVHKYRLDDYLLQID